MVLSFVVIEWWRYVRVRAISPHSCHTTRRGVCGCPSDSSNIVLHFLENPHMEPFPLLDGRSCTCAPLLYTWFIPSNCRVVCVWRITSRGAIVCFSVLVALGLEISLLIKIGSFAADWICDAAISQWERIRVLFQQKKGRGLKSFFFLFFLQEIFWNCWNWAENSDSRVAPSFCEVLNSRPDYFGVLRSKLYQDLFCANGLRRYGSCEEWWKGLVGGIFGGEV